MWALYVNKQELESQRLELYQANQWADQAQRERINLCGKIEMRNRQFQESRADIARYEINQEFESQRLQLQQANQWADQAQRYRERIKATRQMTQSYPAPGNWSVELSQLLKRSLNFKSTSELNLGR